MSFTGTYLDEVRHIIDQFDHAAIEQMVELLVAARERRGRVFVLGVGGSAANASHLVYDLRKIAAIETYAPTDNVAELTARINDDGWESVLEGWLRGSHLDADDLIFVLSVGGGDMANNVSPNLVRALSYANTLGVPIVGIVGRTGGFTAQVADACVIVPVVNPDHVTPHSEAMQGVIWHLLVSHPSLKAVPTKWESIR